MKQFLVCLFLAVATSAFAEAEWLTDVHAALDKAAAEHKYVLLDFTGSDWCGWCKKLKAEVFDQQEFIDFAKQNLVLVEVDFPHQKQLSAEQKEANDALARTYKIQGYPTIILLDSMSHKVGETGYKKGGPANYVAHLQDILSMKHADVAATAPEAEPEAPHRPPAFVPVTPVKPNYYTELALKGISGAPGNRMALINGETFMVGDSTKVRVRDTRVQVVCKEIREDSALVTVDGKPCELKLGAKSAPATTAQK
jgi:protein disulfide-isomerase